MHPVDARLMRNRLYLDMDGVLADFDAGYEIAFGIRPDKQKDDVDWKKVRDRDNFYRDLPPMPDMTTLWAFCDRYHPTILTGVPSGVKEAADNKRAWVDKHLGKNIRMVPCRSKEKFLHCEPGDVLVDDWEKYRHLWEKAGGVWVTHTSADRSIEALRKIGFS